MTNTALLVLKLLASVSSVFQCLSPLPSLYEAHKTRDIGELSLLPLVMLCSVCHIWCGHIIFSAMYMPSRVVTL